MKTAVVTDSVACVRKEDAARYGIRIVPVNVFFNGKVYRDLIDLTAEQAYEFLEKAPQFWKSSAASPEQFLEVYQELAKNYQNALVITISSKISMFYQSALTAREIAREEQLNLNIEVMDSGTVTAAEGLIALEAARAALEGKAFEEIVSLASRVKKCVSFVAVLETMRHVYRTGRIPKIASQVGSMLSVKPILSTSDGLVRFIGATRTKAAGIERILNIMHERVNEGGPVHVAVMHADALAEAEKLKERVDSEFDCAEIFITSFSPVMGYATGRGTVALAYFSDGCVARQ